ncbi:MAG: hypothetical protein KDB14_33655, partial [Planctomycetales bacterium]|nr:hypothetical protein [Planctomycetales bacterium]
TSQVPVDGTADNASDVAKAKDATTDAAGKATDGQKEPTPDPKKSASPKGVTTPSPNGSSPNTSKGAGNSPNRTSPVTPVPSAGKAPKQPVTNSVPAATPNAGGGQATVPLPAPAAPTAPNIPDTASPTPTQPAAPVRPDAPDPVLVVPPVQPKTRLPVPSADVQAEMGKKLSEVFGDELAKFRNDPEGAANYLANQAAELRDDPNSRFVALKQAYSLAIDGAAHTVAMHVIQALADDWEMDGLLLERTFLVRASASARDLPRRRKLAAEASRLFKRLMAEKDYDGAESVAKAGEGLAVKIRDANLRSMLQDQQREARTRRIASAQRDELSEKLKISPNDPQLNLEYGLALAVEGEGWDKVLPHLAQAPAGVIQQAAQKDLQVPKDSADQLALADQWAQAAASHAAAETLRRRALYWYLAVAENGVGLDRKLAQQEAEKLVAALGPLAGNEVPAASSLQIKSLAKIDAIPSTRANSPLESLMLWNFTFNESGTQLYVPKPDGISVRSSSDGRELLDVKLIRPAVLRLLAERRGRIAAAYSDGKILLVDLASKAVEQPATGGSTEIRRIAWGHENDTLLALTPTHLVRLDLRGQKHLSVKLPLNGGVGMGVADHLTAVTAYTGAAGGQRPGDKLGAVAVYDTRTTPPRLVAQRFFDHPVGDCALSKDGSIVAVAGLGNVTLIDVFRNRQNTFPFPGTPEALGFVSNRSKLSLYVYGGGLLRTYAVDGVQQVAQHGERRSLTTRYLTISGSGTRMASATATGVELSELIGAAP